MEVQIYLEALIMPLESFQHHQRGIDQLRTDAIALDDHDVNLTLPRRVGHGLPPVKRV